MFFKQCFIDIFFTLVPRLANLVGADIHAAFGLPDIIARSFRFCFCSALLFDRHLMRRNIILVLRNIDVAGLNIERILTGAFIAGSKGKAAKC